MRTIALIALRIGRVAGRALLYPICAYFVLFSNSARAASLEYLTRSRDRRAGITDVFRHYHRFSETILDRVFLAAGRDECFHYEIEGLDDLLATIANGRGCLLFGAHFGSFEVLRTLAARSPARVRVLMHEDNARKINSALLSLNPSPPDDVIALGRPQTMLEVRDAVESGQIVGLLADRVVAGDRLATCDFLGARVSFPRGPFVLAAMLEAPVVLFSAVCRGDGRYCVRFERFVAAPTDPRNETAIAAQCQRYACWLEDKCRADPLNWFNFYDFFAAAPRS
jgi:predicted LPLAT superfamily acyltransferase